MAWRLARSLDTLRDQINTAWPNRSKASDGTIGDLAHQQTPSDHNPNAAGVVTAMDITHDPDGGPDCSRLVANLVASKDPRIKYLIWNGGMWRAYTKPGIPAWTRAPYTGANPHTKHMHISVSENARLYDDSDPWRIRAVPKPPKHTPPWQLVVNGKGLGEGRMTNPRFIRKITNQLVRHGKVILREKP